MHPQQSSTKMYTKAISASVDFGEADKTVKVVFSTLDMIDFDNEVILSGAYTKTIAENGPKSRASKIYHLKDHIWRTDSIVGKLQDLYVEGSQLIGVTRFDESDPIEMLNYSKYKRGYFNQHSVGIIPIKYQDFETHREISEVRLLEGSVVLWGANPETPTLAVKTAYQENPELLYNEIIADLSALRYNLRKNLSEQDLLFTTQNLEDKISQFKTLHANTQPGAVAPTKPLSVRQEIDAFLFDNTDF
ncbi:HK97 family phage prohead protease [Emticicia sp. BO119]|uniref:HK97 family phage prohead protease n=1 Tax=Emticicia sp. BO119 TaxID=2757768 RepID=UPI0015F082C0|nr:HK97 family phage prohead protease [Emticicia sp. BO119]MBA4851344.1 HK97 family phage prohead protease [Emticicia sp. BO119]